MPPVRLPSVLPRALRNNRLLAGAIATGLLILLVLGVMWLAGGREDSVTPAGPRAPRVEVASAPPPAPDVDNEPETNAVVPERTPEATPAPAATPAPTPTEVDLGETALVLTIVEQGTNRPLSGAWATLAIGTDDLEPMRTNATGTVEVPRPSPGEYTARVRWGFGPQHVVEGLRVVEGQVTRALVEYPRRKAFQFQLVDTEGAPLAGRRLKVGLSLYDETEPTARTVEEVITDSRGNFTLLGYDGIRPSLIGSDEAMLFRLRRGGGRAGDGPPRPEAPGAPASGRDDAPRGGFGDFAGFGGPGGPGGPPDGGFGDGFVFGGPGGGRWGRSWSNPVVNFRPLDEQNTVVIEAKGGVVRATATLVNAPELPEGRGYHASVQSPSANYALLRVVKNQFTFFAEPGEDVEITLFRTNYAITGEEIVKGPGGPPPWVGSSREKQVKVKMPDRPGDHAFDIVFENRLLVRGQVVLTTGEPAENVEVRIRGFNVGGAASASPEPFGRFRGAGGDQGGSRPDSNFLVPKTDRDGAFEIALPPAGEYLFSPDRDSLPEGWRGFVAVTRQWEQLQTGEPVIIVLEASSLIWGEVVDERGRPIEGATVRVQGRGIPGSVRNMTTTTDADGLFSLNIPPLKDIVPEGANTAQGDYYVRAQREDYGIGMAPVVADDPDQSVRIVMYRQVQVALKPISDGQPVRSVQLNVLYDVAQFESAFTAGRRYFRRTNDEGIATIGRLPRGITTIIVSAVSGDGNSVGPTREVVVPADADEQVTLVVDLTPREGEGYMPVETPGRRGPENGRTLQPRSQGGS